jgi:sterol desaturase/sphingolipid hydroxylase (fatty acid hydroxylase superfamily)
MYVGISHLTAFYLDTGRRTLIAAAVCTALEVMLPAARPDSWGSRLRGLLNWATYLIFATLTWRAATLGFEWIGLKPVLHIDLGSMLHAENPIVHGAWVIAAAVIVAMVGDFFYYWFHRMQHSVGFFWRFHAVHHSIREMNAFNCNHHISEDLLRLPFLGIPLTLMQFDTGAVPAVAIFLLGIQPIFEHSSTRLHLGPLRYLIGDPRFHRIHHSIERRHWNVNFGSFTTIWDSLFRTAVFPERGQWPVVGLEDVLEPKSTWNYVMQPFRRKGSEEPEAEIAQA